ncbi:hypothetical protein AXF42_Ash001745 [Apostasia shenzhenica]|uniref:Uncharacterized protein n=1 Tax=Apostasia shenzhenica TaxID=1088818 RepID=A0A2I0AB47_9ASPA|nr:hypothetical protein AXF42_Ash001745 [Apostasia shenzhenica]
MKDKKKKRPAKPASISSLLLNTCARNYFNLVEEIIILNVKSVKLRRSRVLNTAGIIFHELDGYRNILRKFPSHRSLHYLNIICYYLSSNHEIIFSSEILDARYYSISMDSFKLRQPKPSYTSQLSSSRSDPTSIFTPTFSQFIIMFTVSFGRLTNTVVATGMEMVRWKGGGFKRIYLHQEGFRGSMVPGGVQLFHFQARKFQTEMNSFRLRLW